MAYSTINQESKLLSTISSDLDQYRSRYSTYEKQIDGSNVNISFVSPKFSIWEDNRFFIFQNCVVKDLDLKYHYRPDYLSYMEYGTTNWWALLMWINDCKSIEYFNYETVLVPTTSCLSELALQTQKDTQIKNFNDDEFQYLTYCVLYRTPVLDANSMIKMADDTISKLLTKPTITKTLPSQSVFTKQQFTMTIPILRLRYVDLEKAPDINSLTLIIKGKSNVIYGKNYSIIEDDNGVLRRLTWDPAHVGGNGLIFKLKENDIIQVSYV